MKKFRRAIQLAYIVWRKPKVFYDLVAVTRGPDFRADSLKWVFTAWIRYLFFPAVTANYRVMVRTGYLRENEVGDLVEELKGLRDSGGWDITRRFGLTHFLIHIRHGLDALHFVPWLTIEERLELEVLQNFVLLLKDLVRGGVDGERIGQLVWDWWYDQYDQCLLRG